MTPQIFTAKVMHQRLFPKKNKFTYRVYYLLLPLPAPDIKHRFVSFAPQDLGRRDGSDPGIFAKEILDEYGFTSKVSNIMLLTMPKVCGYIFNPVSFYFCFNEHQKIIAVIAEVHNTFGEQHTYFCANPNYEVIDGKQWLEADKVFHVSPFLPRNGKYKFKFSIQKNTINISINYIDNNNNIQLITSLVGNLAPLTSSSLRKAFWLHPGVTIKTIILIHWQALKLLAKTVRYIKKPPQQNTKLSATLSVQKVPSSKQLPIL